MWRRWVLALCILPAICAAAPKPADWVPVRWPWSDVAIARTAPGIARKLPADAGLPAGAHRRGGRTRLDDAGRASSRAATLRRRRANALAAKVDGIVLDGDFPDAAVSAVREAAGGATVIELTSRSRMKLGSPAPILGTYQGVWPGISVQDDGAKKAGPTGSTWIDTNTGFIRAVRALGKCGAVARQRAAAARPS